jgi:hypothetical protein
LPHSVGLQKGLVGVVHAFADPDMTGSNNVVITHEILHTLGASDKYDLATLAPVYPVVMPNRIAILSIRKSYAEIMAGRYPTGRKHLRDAGIPRLGAGRRRNRTRNPLVARSMSTARRSSKPARESVPGRLLVDGFDLQRATPVSSSRCWAAWHRQSRC